MRIWASLRTYYSIYYTFLSSNSVHLYMICLGLHCWWFCFCYSFVGVLWGFLNHYSLLPLIFPFLGEILYFPIKVWFSLCADDSKMYILAYILSPPPPVFSHQPIPIWFYWVISFVNFLALPNLPYLCQDTSFRTVVLLTVSLFKEDKTQWFRHSER